MKQGIKKEIKGLDFIKVNKSFEDHLYLDLKIKSIKNNNLLLTFEAE